MKGLVFLLLYNTGQAQDGCSNTDTYCQNATLGDSSCAHVCICDPCPDSGQFTQGICSNCVLVADYKTSASGCPAGTFWQQGLKDCIDCPEGFYSSAGKDKCRICPAGSSCNSQGITGSCGANQVSPEGFQDCLTCPPSFEPDGQEKCVEKSETCSNSNKYKPYDSLCINTPAGYTSDGSNGLTQCPDTQYSTGASSCVDCPEGKKCDRYGGQEDCLISAGLSPKTPVSTTGCQHCTRGTDCTTLSDCGVGKQWDETSKICVSTDCDKGPCDGSFQYNCDPGMTLIGNLCEPCPLVFNSTGQVKGEVGICPQTKCPAGYGFSSGSCELCDDSHHSDGSSACQSCDLHDNLYCPNRDGVPVECPTGYYKKLSTDKTCSPCPEGNSCDALGASPCGPNEYSYEGDSVCRACLPGHECNSSTAKMCRYGEYINGNSCTPCPKGNACPNPWENEQPCTCNDDGCNFQDATGQIECKPCPAGKTCTESTASSCASGKYSLEGQKSCENCPPGSMCPTADSPPVPCDPGYYAPANSIDCTICDINWSCDKEGKTVACGPNEYSPLGVSECFQCPNGHSCGTGIPVPCSPGQYSLNGVCTSCSAGNYCPIGSNSQITCPVGHKCPANAFAPTLCPPGKFQTNTGQSSCSDCTPGYTCDGYTKKTCPVGHFCIDSTISPVPCPKGEYQDETGQTGCKTGAAGFYCPPGAIECHLCPAGSYCNSGTKANCPAGKYSEEEGRSSQCDEECPLGHYCPAGTSSPFPCPPGFYQDTIGESNCKPCPDGKSCSSSGLIKPDRRCDHGHFCSSSSNYPNSWAPSTTWRGNAGNPSTMCPAGKYSAKTDNTGESQCETCPAGFYCFPGTGNGLINPIKCPAGYYCEGTQGLEVRDADGNEVDIPFKFPLDPAYGTKPSWETGSGENYRPRGCLAGTWSNQTGVSDPNECWVCEQGWMCTFGTNQLDQGDVVDLIELPAPFDEVQHDFYFEENYFRRSQIQAMKCPRGCYCSPGTGYGVTDNYNSQLTYGFINNFYSDYTLKEPQGCPPGTYNDEEGIGRVSDCKSCEPGYYCDGAIKDENLHLLNREPLDEYEPGTVVPDACPAGFYNPNYGGSSFADDCPQCPGGWHCPENATSVPTECGKGKYSDVQAIVCLDCEPGYYCDNSTTSKEDMLNNKKCPPGIDCSVNSPDYPISIIPELFQNPCPLGYYCPDVDPVPCPPGTFGGEFGLSEEDQCTPCTEGYYCPPLGVPPTGAGEWPTIEVPSCEFDHISLGNYTCNAYKECRPGRYCETGSYEETECVKGTYQPFPRAKSKEECAPCKSGNYCDEPGLAEPKPCPAGFYCEFNVDNFISTPCPPGTYSISESLRSKYECPLCGGGLYCSGELDSLTDTVKPPKNCTAGVYCRQGSPSEDDSNCNLPDETDPLYVPGVECPIICPQGAYCPAGSFTPQPCEEGTYTTGPGKGKNDDCEMCKAGHFCSGEVLSDPVTGVYYDGTSGQCEGGYYCPGGNIRSNGKDGSLDTRECSPGTFCPLESADETACSDGEYQEYKLGAECEICPPGHKCTVATGTFDPVICENGEYCDGAIVNDCDAGKYLNVTELYDTTIISPYTMGGSQSDPTKDINNVSTECPAGFTCPAGTGSKFENPCAPGTFNENPLLDTSCSACTAGRVCDKYATVGSTNVTFVDCPAGYFCPERACKIVPTLDPANTNDPCEDVIEECPAGYHCPLNSAEPKECPAGTYSDRKLLSGCFDCEAGFFCPGEDYANFFSNYDDCINESYCRIPCPAGSKCESTGLSAPKECDIGEFNPYVGALQCLPCEAGKACPTKGISIPTDDIDSGYYSISGADTKTPSGTPDVNGPCPDGYICGSGQTLPNPCAEGEESESASKSTTCVPCGEGKFCPKKATESSNGLPCLDGFSCESGCISANSVTEDKCVVCPVGHECKKGSISNCEQQYQPSVGQNECLDCPAGKDCEKGIAADCPEGHYCEESKGKAECGRNTFADVTGLQNSSECSPCPPGIDCSKETLPISSYPTTPCPAGNKCLGGDDPLTCTSGGSTYCPEGSINDVAVPTGQLSSDAATLTPCAEDEFCTGNNPSACSNDHHCPVGTPFEIPCGRPGAESCFSCDENFYCPYDASQNPCLPGFLCPPDTPIPTKLCPAGTKCNDGISVDCNGAEYNPAEGQSECIECPAGGDCTSTGKDQVDPTDCPGGSFCEFGHVTEDCAAGSFGTDLSTGAQSQEHCHECPYGKYCTGGKDNNNCSIDGKECPIGTETDSPDECPEGHICIQGKKELCPSSLYPDSSNINCIACTEGGYCPGDGSYVLCNEGYYCPSSSDTLRPDHLCPVGNVCPDGSEKPQDCSPGNKTIELGSEVCMNCDAGYYCENGSDEKECGAGIVCAPGSTDQSITCSDGYSSSVTGLTDQSECQQCEVGTYCKDGKQTSCDPGCDCQAESSVSCPNNCPAGSECSLATALPCPPGQFNDGTIGNALSCDPCVDGNYQDQHGQSTCIDSCAEGFYCNSGAKSEYPSRLSNGTDFGICPTGHYCTGGKKAECQEGTYQDREGQNACFDCPAGYLCNEKGLDDYINHPCPAGQYCGRKALTGIDCPSGKYRTTEGARSEEECQLCEPGKVCPGKDVQNDCPAGYYCFVGAKDNGPLAPEPFNSAINITIDGTDRETVGICPIGHYCPAETALPKPCPAGFYCDIEGMEKPDTSKECPGGMYCISGAKDDSTIVIPNHKIDCPPGFYCPKGTKVPIMCPAGTYRNVPGGADKNSCSQCQEGFVCYQGQIETDENQCPEGFFCEAGVKDIYDRTGPVYTYFCPPGFSCKDGIREPCQAGTYQADRGKLTCNTCPAGYYCQEDLINGIWSPTSCPKGTYCRAGSDSATDCPVGTFGLTSNLQSESQCTACLAGHYCDKEGMTKDLVLANKCNEGYLCTPGSSGPNGQRDGSDEENRCELGSYCPAGTPVAIKCPAGKFNDGSDPTMFVDCAICTEDFYCEYSGTIRPVACPKFYLCPNEDSDPGETGLDVGAIIAKTGGSVTPFVCPLYHQCDDGLIRTAATCPDNTYREEFEMDPSHTEHCQPCPSGKTCQQGQILDLCAKGNFCDEDVGTVPCPLGSYNPNLGSFLDPNITCDKDIANLQACAVEQKVCLACPAGYYCDNPLGTSLPKQCNAGYYCNQNSFDKEENLCPVGHYCPAGTAEPVPCPVGTYLDDSGKEKLDDCKLCPPKKFCDEPGLFQTFSLIDCKEGYFCGLGSPSRTPEVQVDNRNSTGEYYGPCIEGEYCPSGDNAAPIPCPVGEYNDLVHQGKCSTCPAGYECPGGDVLPTPCKEGYFCPTSETIPQMCPPGTYNPSTLGYLEGTHCQKCPDGKICDQLAQEVPTTCPQKSYCQGGIQTQCKSEKLCDSIDQGYEKNCPYGSQCTDSDAGPCEIGSYCENSTPTKCEPGSYCPSDSEKYPTLCEPGTTSNVLGATVDTCNECTQGYCPQYGNSDDSLNTVSDGFYCDSTKPCGATSTPNSCEPGFMCKNGLRSECSASTEFQSNSEQSECLPCGDGFTCDSSQRFECPEGTYCAAGENIEHECKEGSIGFVSGASDEQEACRDCPPGYNCDKKGMKISDLPSNQCPVGYYCELGTDGLNIPECEEGKYCNGTSTDVYGFPCPVSTFSNSAGLEDEGQCSPCSANRYCPRSGLSNIDDFLCLAGYDCFAITGNSQPNLPDNICPEGKYCEQAMPAVNCSENFYLDRTGATQESDCDACPAGKDCSKTSGISDSLDDLESCPQGSYCPGGVPQDCDIDNDFGVCDEEGLTDPIPCADGTLQSLSICIPCAPGSKCFLGMESDKIKNIEEDCGAGFYCLAGTERLGEPCPSSTFSNALIATDDSTCTSCTAGNYCVGLGQTSITGDCEEGYWCSGGNESPRPENELNSTGNLIGNACSPGEECDTIVATPCAEGFYQPDFRKNHCEMCPAGFYCKEKGTTVPVECPQGNYCPEGTGSNATYEDGIPCPDGSTGSRPGLVDFDDCTLCAAGKYCNSTSISIDPQGLNCTEGHYCSGGSSVPDPCQAEDGDCDNLTDYEETCWDSLTLSNKTVGGVCVPGYFCPEGSARPRPCDAGKSCQGLKLSEPDGGCDPGYYCPTGSKSPQEKVCLPGHYCLADSAYPEPCPPGTYDVTDTVDSTHRTNSSICIENESQVDGFAFEGWGNTFLTGVECEAGWYCEKGTYNRYGDLCTRHHYCPKRSYYPIPCPTGKWQPNSGSIECTDCPAGWFCNVTDIGNSHREPPSAEEYPKPCEIGYYCPEGTTKQEVCPDGTYGNRTRLASADDCLTCPPGYYCSDGFIVGMCQPGTFCTGGQGPNYARGLSYYLDISESWRGQFQYPEGASGFCQAGTYCPEGSHAPIPCPPGFFGNSGNQSDFTLACEPAQPGKYVGVEAGSSSDEKECQNGFYCAGRSKLSRPYDDAALGNLGGTICPAGRECETGNIALCNNGTFQVNEGQNQCIECTPGYLCPQKGVTLPFSCPEGSYCEEGSSEGSECAEDSFNPVERQSDSSSCYPCKGGFKCNGGDNVDVCSDRNYCPEGQGEILCPAGHLCTEQLSSPEPCETGSYQPSEGKTDCEPCLGGHYCEFRGAKDVTGPCEGGYYCNGNVTDPRPSPEKCLQGEACPIGAIDPILCNNGSYAPLDLMEKCEICPPGYYCDGIDELPFWRTKYEGVVLPIECNKDEYENVIPPDEFGYCEEGSRLPTRCPSGSLVQGAPQLFDSTECEPCPTGYYCEGGAIAGECEKGSFCLASSGEKDSKENFFDEHILSENTLCDTDQKNGCAGKCPPGYLCEEGTDLPIPCPQGQKLADGTLLTAPGCEDVGPGEFGVQGLFDSEGKPFLCPEGYYCPGPDSTQNITADPIPCPVGTYMNSEGAKDKCTACIGGYDCTELGLRNYETFICPPGHYCLAGEGREPCPNSTWRPDVGGSSDIIGHEDGCSLCPEGEYCPENVINDAGVPCPPGFTCPEGTEIADELCPAGYYCPESSFHERYPCSAGFYCELGSWNETVCEFPYYCPPLTDKEFGFTCDLGHGALAGLNRTNEEEFCQLCPAGTYRSREDQPECEPCPAGMSCPEGTGEDPREPILCPIGHYCPTGNPLGRPIPCPPGTFSNEVGAQQEACQPCPVDTYNNLEGQAACRLCGTASIAREGSIQCQCIGTNRIFQFSDGSCICKQGYESHGYDEADDETEVNKRSDCVEIVNDRCDDGFVRDAFTRECITVDDADQKCEDSNLQCKSGSPVFDQNYGTCFCSIVDAVEDIEGCCYIPEASVDVATGELTIDGETIDGVYGLSPVNKTSAFTVSLSSSGVFADLPVNGSTRARRQAEFASAEQIQQPAICLLPGEMVLFELDIKSNTAESHYPKYQVGSLYNSNPDFDYGAFRTLEAVILEAEDDQSLNFDKFAYIFEQEGNFVFYSSQNELYTIIIHVALEGTSCGSGTEDSENIRVQPQSERTFSSFGISRTTNINLTPNWPLIASLSITIILLILILLVFSTVWSRKDRSFSPWQYWKPKYLATDMPYVYPPLVAKNMEHNLDEDLLEEENQQREDHLTSQELFDRLEDQNLQIASQMQNHQRQLQEYFESMHQEAAKLQAFIQKAKEPKQQSNSKKANKIQKNELDQSPKDQTAARALMTTVQQLLNQLNQGRVLITEEMVDAVLQNKSDKKNGLEAGEQEKIVKEEIELVEKLCTVDLDSEDELARLVKEEADLLANAKDEQERNEIIANYSAMKAALQKRRKDDLEKQKAALRQRLVARRRQDLAKRDMENKTEKMLAEERSGAIVEMMTASKQVHSDKKKRIKAVYMNKMSTRVKPENKDQFVIAADNAMDQIENDFAAKILSDLERVDESGSVEWEEICKAMEANFASEQDIATAKANHDYQLLVEKQAVLENVQTTEIDEISKTLQGLIEKYSNDPDSILNDFNQQMAEKLHKDKIKEIERDALAKLKAMNAVDLSGDDELDGQFAQQLAEVADKQASEREELERELAEKEAEEQRRLEEELARQQKQTMSELNAKQQAEIEARQGNLTDSQMKMMLLAHSKAQEEAQDALNDKHAAQQDALKARLAKMRRDKTMKLETNQEEEMSKEKERIDEEIKEQTRQKQLEAEKEAAMKLIADTGASTEEVIDAIMDRRHRAEIEAFNAEMDEELSRRLEAATEDGVLPEHAKAKIEHDMQVERAAGLLNLKEKHYQEKLAMLTELAPLAAKNAENDKKKLEKARKKIEEEQAQQERELAAEREKWEAEQKRLMEEEMGKFESELDQKLLEEEQRLAEELEEKQKQREKAENEKKQQLEEELAQKLAENAQADHARLLAEHQSQIDKISARQGLDKAKMAEQIKKRLEAKKQIAMKEKQVEVDGDHQLAVEDFEKNQVEKISERKAAAEEVEEEEEFDGPLTEAQLKKVLAGLPLLGSLNNIKNFLQKSFLDEDVVYGDINPIDISELDKVELLNYNYAIYLLKFFKSNLRAGDATRIVISEPIPQSKNEFGTDLYVSGNDLVIRRRVFSTEPGKLAVVLSWAFATAVGEQKKSKGKTAGFVQQVFFQTQSLLMNEAFLLLNSDNRRVPKELTEN
ncbi:Oidioi.mRNA.OKI2018_I69.XSR.g16008.t1.cds [Oikopleura dioica]|uniref:Oidioi.mRNA.OKI2018_I69.XSR.g16008.t1.cds n=1 Tax=Oikopleura dioica TaxID=34765 RepID=A0ABN7SIX2_OIKDI|nr:Oidioi.mRNA.OKI2018_I69.XSR.g16008.t1.cds [Oikopleura dioica]